MIYFRVALRKDQWSQWRWNSNMLSTPGTLFAFLSMYESVPKNRLHVFFATSVEFMNEMLVRENSGLVSNSITVEDFLKSGRKIDGQRIKELEFELGLQESKELIAKSAITRKLGDEHVSLPAIPSYDTVNYTTLEAKESGWASNPLGQIQDD